MALDEVLSVARKENRTVLTEVEAKNVVLEAGIPVVDTQQAGTKQEAVDIAEALGFPVVVKVASPDFLHKSDIGGVRMNLNSGAEVLAAWDEIMGAAKKANPKASIQGVSVQKIAPQGIEVIIGGTKDPQFGPVLMFGLGGVFVEVLKDCLLYTSPSPRD